MKACVLAAGKSSRIAEISRGVPKPLLPVAGLPLLFHNLLLLKRYGIRDIWINLHYRPQAIRSAVQRSGIRGLRLSFSHEKKILGTAGAVKNLENHLSSGTFMVLYGDNYTDCNLKELVTRHKKTKAMATIAVYHQKKNVSSGIVGGKVILNKQHEVKKFIEGKEALNSESPYVNAGIYALEPEILDSIPEGFSDFGKAIFPLLLQKGIRIAAYPMKGFCLAVDTPEAYKKAQDLADKSGRRGNS